MLIDAWFDSDDEEDEVKTVPLSKETNTTKTIGTRVIIRTSILVLKGII